MKNLRKKDKNKYKLNSEFDIEKLCDELVKPKQQQFSNKPKSNNKSDRRRKRK